MEKQLLEVLKYCQNIESALSRTMTKFATVSSIILKERARIYASTGERPLRGKNLEGYINSLDVSVKGGKIVIELDPDDWLSNALEDGAKGWDMKETHLKNAKVSSSGFRYKIIPIRPSKQANPQTDNGRAFQDKLVAALKKPQWRDLGGRGIKTLSDGRIQKLSELVTDDPDLKGLYRIQRFKDAQTYQNGGKGSNEGYVKFRTMSDKPGNENKWIHPGIEGRFIFKKLQDWLDREGDKLFNGLLNDELSKVLD